MKKNQSTNSKKSNTKNNHSYDVLEEQLRVAKIAQPFLLFKYLLTTFLLFCSLPLFADHTHCHSHGVEKTFIDETYHYINNSFCQPALWFDDFFADKRITEDTVAGTMIRWYSDISWSKQKHIQYNSKLTARIYLPKATKRLKLILESDSEDSLLALFPDNVTEPENSFGLQYDWPIKERRSLNLKVTVKPSIELRYRYLLPLSSQFNTRLTQKIYQKKKITGAETLFDVDYSINKYFLARWTNFVKIETDKVVKLGTGAMLYQYISGTQAINYKTSIAFQDKPDYASTTYNFSVSYRQNILRKWFYYEVKPEVSWKETTNSVLHSEPKLTVRFEVLFNNI